MKILILVYVEFIGYAGSTSNNKIKTLKKINRFISGNIIILESYEYFNGVGSVVCAPLNQNRRGGLFIPKQCSMNVRYNLLPILLLFAYLYLVPIS